VFETKYPLKVTHTTDGSQTFGFITYFKLETILKPASYKLQHVLARNISVEM